MSERPTNEWHADDFFRDSPSSMQTLDFVNTNLPTGIAVSPEHNNDNADSEQDLPDALVTGEMDNINSIEDLDDKKKSETSWLRDSNDVNAVLRVLDDPNRSECVQMVSSAKIYQRLLAYVYVQLKFASYSPPYSYMDNVDSKCMPYLEPCEALLRSYEQFSNYRSTLAIVNPPCIPFIGVYLNDLTFTQDAIRDHLQPNQPNVINFEKCQRIAEVIREIKHWQSTQFNLRPLPVVLRFIEESLAGFNDRTNWDDYLWNASLEREPN